MSVDCVKIQINMSCAKKQPLITLDDGTTVSYENFCNTIKDKNAAIEKRMQYLFVARDLGGDCGLEALKNALEDSSVLLVHEAVYLIGQLGISSSIPKLIQILKDVTYDCIIRHEAAEALAAIGDKISIETISQHINDDSIPVRETCILALRSLKEKNKLGKPKEFEKLNVKYLTVDPIAEVEGLIKQNSVQSLKKLLLDDSLELYLRYQALFALRDIDDSEAHEAIIEALLLDKSSALFRHEIAFVLGQIRTDAALNALFTCLSDKNEHPMARHESALAIASVINSHPERSSEAENILREYSLESCRIVAESCLVGLSMIAAGS